jgi:hypothetical protein
MMEEEDNDKVLSIPSCCINNQVFNFMPITDILPSIYVIYPNVTRWRFELWRLRMLTDNSYMHN